MLTLEQHRAAVASAQEVLNAGRRELLREDGSRKYSDIEHTERTAQLETAFRTTIREAAAAGDAARREAEAELAKASPDPLHSLTDAELARVASLETLLARDAESLPLPALVEKAEAALSASRADRCAWLRILEQRSRDLRAAASRGQVNRDPMLARAAATAETLRERFRDSLIDPAKRKAAEARAQERISEGQTVVNRAVVTEYYQRVYGPRPTSTVGVRP